VHVIFYLATSEDLDLAIHEDFLMAMDTILTGCGSRDARDTWMIVTGQVKEPALQAEYLLLVSRSHVLVWNVQ